MIGPVMIGPSSSHTAGVAKIGLLAHNLFGGVPAQATITFYNSFATTYKGHGSDKAILGGLLGMRTDDPGIRTALEAAEERGMAYAFEMIGNASQYHPNSIGLVMEGDGQRIGLMGESLGGGVINIASVDGYKAGFNGDLTTLMITADDRPGVIAFVSDILAHDSCNIATMTVSRLQKNGYARHFIEVDSAPRPLTIQYLQSLPWIAGLRVIEPIS